jgi:Cytochrome P460
MRSRICVKSFRSLLLVVAVLWVHVNGVAGIAHAADPPTKVTDSDCTKASGFPLPLPSQLKQAAFQNYDVTVYDFLNCETYRKLGWARDKAVRDTGPFINNVYYGTHPAVRIFYSPQIITWLKGGKKGNIPDGAMIIKEHFKPPAARYTGMSDAEIDAAFKTNGKDWTIMIRDARGSKDGWYWAEVFTGMSPDATTAYKAPFAYPNGGFGQYCLNCHASAKDSSTFSALNNIRGFPGESLTYRVDNSWRPSMSAKQLATPSTSTNQINLAIAAAPVTAVTAASAPANPPDPVVIHAHKKRDYLRLSVAASSALTTATGANPAFLDTFKWIKEVPLASVQKMVPETLDRTVAKHKGPAEFLSSDQCLGCHSAISGNNPIMYLPTPPSTPPATVAGVNVSPYGEWRWSPMGLAGRDPIFYAQLDSELAYINSLPDKKTAKSLTDTTINTCFRCHGVMGKRQWDSDTKCDPTNPVKPCNPADPSRPQFKAEFTQISDTANPHAKYGALARDGVSCMACHSQQETKQPPGKQQNSLKYFLENSITGLFQTGPKDKVIGPFTDVATLPMKHALGVKPGHNDYIKSSRMCGSCHSIYLPVIDRKPIKPVGPDTHYNMEQATYLEWLNSKYQNEVKPFAACSTTQGNGTAVPPQACAQSCQNCHMPGGFHNKELNIDVPQIKTQIAAVQDQTYSTSDGVAPTKDITVKYRESGFARHELLGTNVFLLEMVKQFNNIFGVRTSDYMSGSTTGIEQTINRFTTQAQERTARIETNVVSVDAAKLVADVKVTNLAGHRLPSGVGFRRAFIEFVVQDNSSGKPRVVWASGRTNSVGVIVDGEGKVLPTEFFDEYIDKNGKKRQYFQPHYQQIDAQNQVQIYEELVRDADGMITTSFLRRNSEFKDNRLLPTGWTKAGPDPKNFTGVYLAATYPKGEAAKDPEYVNGSGTDSLRYNVTLPAGLDPKNLSVRATLYYQSIPPYFLAMRFAQAPNAPATQRLFYLTSNLDLTKSPAKDWKIKLTSTEQIAVKK